MAQAADPKCPDCMGSGYRVVDARRDVSVVCHCMRTDVVASRLGPWLSKAERILITPLEGRHKENLLLLARPKTANAHLRKVLEGLPGLTFHDITDADILDAFLGKSDLVEVVTEADREHGSLADLVRPPDLLILRASIVSYPNKALPGVFLQALRLREHAGKPTWLVFSPGQPFSQDHLCWSEAGDAYVDDLFALVSLEKDVPTPTKGSAAKRAPGAPGGPLGVNPVLMGGGAPPRKGGGKP